MNRRLVPIPPRKRLRAVERPLLPPARRAVPPLRWPLSRADGAALLITMAALGALWPLRHMIILIAASFFVIRGWWLLTWRYPRTMTFVNLVLIALLSGSRRRRG